MHELRREDLKILERVCVILTGITPQTRIRGSRRDQISKLQLSTVIRHIVRLVVRGKNAGVREVLLTITGS